MYFRLSFSLPFDTHNSSCRLINMPEYVYALYDFIPELSDEVAFKAGERIEVIEKDELYGDGWWKVCTLT